MNKILIIALLFSLQVLGAYSRNFGRDLKLPSQKMLEMTEVEDCAAVDPDYILTTNNGDTTGAATTVTTFTKQPDVARALTVTPTGTTADVAAGNVVISGTNCKGETVTDTLAFLENASTATTGVVAFKTVTSIVFPAEDSPYSATWTVGVSDKLGLCKCLDDAGDVAWASADGTYEATRPTCTADEDEVEKNVCDPNTACDGSKDFKFYFIQNFRDL
jgi:hypothetical protein